MAEPGRVGFALPAASVLRDRADRVGERAGRQRLRPRTRYLQGQRARLAAQLLPTLAILAALTGATAICDLVGWGAPSPRSAIVVLAVVTIILGGLSLAVPLLRKSYKALVAVAGAAAFTSMFGWAIAIRLCDGTADPYLLVIALVLVVFVSMVRLPPRLGLAIGACSYAAIWVEAPGAPVVVHLVMIALAITGYTVARHRHLQSLKTFLRIERLSGAVVRMRRVQEQLVLVEKLEALRVLVGGMAHELNNALAVSVASNQQALREAEHSSPAAAAAMRRSDGGLARIRRTVDRLRRFAMAAEGTLEPADVGAMLDFALESAIGRARSGVIIERVYDPGVGAIECHVAALAEALFQIARNAVEAMPGGGTIQAIVRNEGERVVLAVVDEGRGIPADQLARVFDPFYSRAQGQKSGMGLSAVYGLVSALGGSIEIQSAVNKGTEVAIRLPRKKQSRSSIPPPPPSLRPDDPGRGH